MLLLVFDLVSNYYRLAAGLAVVAVSASGICVWHIFSRIRRLDEGVDELRERARDSESAERRLSRIFSELNEAVFIADPKGILESVNAAGAALCGSDERELIGRNIDDILKPVSAGTRTVAQASEARPGDAEVVRADGQEIAVSFTKTPLSDDQGNPERVIYAAQNIDERKRTEQRMRYLAQTDALTKIANRMEFQHRLQQAIARARRGQQYLGLLYLDVDRFKDINDTFGHAAGDQSLELFASRIGNALPENTIFGRLAGDEFSVLLPAKSDMEKLVAESTSTADQLLRAVARPFDVEGEEIFMSTSIGIAVYPRDGDNVVDLLRNADAAMYHAKSAGGNCFEIYENHMNSSAEERLKLKSKLTRAFERDELRLHYQPKYRLSDGKVAGAEALVRWDLPDYGLVFPSDFIPLAEESNLILQVGEWVLDRVCSDYREWQRHVPSPCRISINLSLRQLQQRRFVEGVRRTFKEHNVSPTCLELEITETTLMEDTRAAVRLLDALYGMGLHLAIDDFGTGYSSLSALQQFPLDTLKIDRSFVKDIAIDKDNASIVRAIIQMAHSLNLEVVAEGVEHASQLEFLRQNDCDFAQGNLLGDPMAADDFLAVLVEDSAGKTRYQALFG